MRDTVAQEVLERGCHAVQHATVHLYGSPEQVESHLFSGFFGGQPDDAIQPVRNAFKLDHSGAQQVALQFAGLPRLGNQVVLGSLNRPLQRSLYGRDVIDGLSHHAGQFLHAGETIKFKRVETGLKFTSLRQPRLHLGFSLQLNVTQLLPQAVQVVIHVEQRAPQLAQFNLKAGASNHHLASLVNHAV